jgi:hypothetical protein
MGRALGSASVPAFLLGRCFGVGAKVHLMQRGRSCGLRFSVRL